MAKGVKCLQSVPPFLVQAWAGLKLSIFSRILLLKVGLYQKSGAINGKEGKAAALSKFSDTSLKTISTREGRLCPPIGDALPKISRDYAPVHCRHNK